MLSLRVISVGACDRVQARARAKIADIDAKLRSLRQMKEALAELVAACERRGKTNDCPILNTLEAHREEL